jgi:hypothetical protein
MPKSKTPELDGYQLNASVDMPDSRDWLYRAPPVRLKSSIKKPADLFILDQKSEGACTGFGLAAVINFLNHQRGIKRNISARMLYEMARKHDEWPGEEYSGSSCRGAIKGFANMGVCRDRYWPYKENKPGHLSVKAAKDARSNTLGAYYRLSRRISDFHAAINEAGIVYCSANVHGGWSSSAIKNGVIPHKKPTTGGHAFAIIGYNQKGFWVQNSWDKRWGRNGVALWTYEDWHENLSDGWVISLALPTPQIWQLGDAAGVRTEGVSKPSRGAVAGHFVHIDDGKFHDSGRYWSNLDDVKNTAELLAKSTDYKHLLIYAHGGLNSPADSAARIAAMRDVFKENGIYPFHFMYDTGVMEEVKDIISSRGKRVNVRATGPIDLWDKLLERLARPIGRALWREIKFGAHNGFINNNAGVQTLQALKSVLGSNQKIKLHIVGHSTGAILLGHLLNALKDEVPSLQVNTCSLLAPAMKVDLFNSAYKPLLNSPEDSLGINKMAVYNLSDTLEKEDTVGPYRKSLLYFVSRSFEEATPESILGMQRYSKNLDNAGQGNLEFIYSHGDSDKEPRTLSKSHGGFDNDIATMNDILARVLDGKPVKRAFKPLDLKY